MAADDDLMALTITREALQRKTEDSARSNQTIYTVGGLLVGASAINASLLSSATYVTGWMAISVALSLVAAILGVAAIYPRQGKFVTAEAIQSQFASLPLQKAAKWFNEALVEQLADHKPKVALRWRLVSLGLISLALAIVASLAPILQSIIIG